MIKILTKKEYNDLLFRIKVLEEKISSAPEKKNEPKQSNASLWLNGELNNGKVGSK